MSMCMAFDYEETARLAREKAEKLAAEEKPTEQPQSEKPADE